MKNPSTSLKLSPVTAAKGIMKNIIPVTLSFEKSRTEKNAIYSVF